MKLSRWGEVCCLHYGKALRGYSEASSDEEAIRVYGTNGPIGWTSQVLSPQAGIIVGRKGAYRGVHFSAEPFFVIDTAYHLEITSHEVDLRWAYYKLLTVDINRMDVGAAIPTTNRDEFYAMTLSYPELTVQKRCVEALSAYDDLIENNRRRIAFLEEAARQLYREWFVRLRFPGHEHTRIINGTPEGWEQKRLGDVLTLKRGYDLPEADRVPGDIPIVSSSGITGFHDTKKADAPGVVTGRYGTLGEVHFIDRDYWPLNTALYVSDFKGNPASLTVHVLRHTLQSIQSDKAAVPGLNRNVVHTLPVLWPAKALRDRFDAFAQTTIRQISILNAAKEKLRAARDLLLPRLMSGEIAV